MCAHFGYSYRLVVYTRCFHRADCARPALSSRSRLTAPDCGRQVCGSRRRLFTDASYCGRHDVAVHCPFPEGGASNFPSHALSGRAPRNALSGEPDVASGRIRLDGARGPFEPRRDGVPVPCASRCDARLPAGISVSPLGRPRPTSACPPCGHAVYRISFPLVSQAISSKPRSSRREESPST